MSVFKAAILQLIVLYGMSSMVFAKTENTRISATVFADIRYDDNADPRSASADDEPLAERQLFYGLNVSGDYTAAHSRFALNYTAREEDYSKDSQPNETTVFGKSSFSLSNDVKTIGIDVSHDQTRVLNDPNDIERSVNTTRQSAVSVRPYVDLLRAKSNALKLTGIYEDVSYDSGLRESYVETGAELAYSKTISAIRSIGLRGERSEFEFDGRADLDYRQGQLSAFFQTALRELSYGIELGSRSVIVDGSDEKDKSPFYRVSLDYLVEGFKIALLSETALLNTSSYQGVQLIDSSIAVGTTADEADRVDVLSNQISIERDHFYGGRLAFLYSVRDNEYATFTQNNSDISWAQVSFTYPYSLRSDLGIDVSIRKVSFDNTVNEGLSDRRIRMRYRYQFPRRLSAIASIQRREQTLGDREIPVSLFALKLSYLID